MIRPALLAVLAVLLLAAPASAAERPCPDFVQAPSAIVIEPSTGTVACARNPDERRSIASTTKLMTALLTLEKAKLSDVYTAARYFPSSAESRINLQPGERMTVRDLLRGLLVESGNDAAVTLAEGVGGSRQGFVRMMNRRAKQLKLTNTHYSNPIGLDEAGNYSSARDLVKLGTYLRTYKFFRTTVDRAVVRLTSGNRQRVFDNRNDLVKRYGWINGVKSGHTSQAGYVLVGSGRRGEVQLVSAVLGTPSVAARDDATLKLLNWARTRFQRVTVLEAGDEVTSVPIAYARGAKLPLVAQHTVMRVVPRGRRDDVKPRAVDVPDEVEGPIVQGQSFGTIEILYKGRVVEKQPLVAGATVPAADLEQKAKSWFTGPIPILLLFGALAGTVIIVTQLRRNLRDHRRSGGKARAA